jgi:hypothetical protein
VSTLTITPPMRLEEEFEDKKMVIRIHRSKKDGHHNTVHIIPG